MESVIAIIIGIALVLKLVSYVRSTDDPNKSVGSVQTHDIQKGLIGSTLGAKKFKAQNDYLIAKSAAVTSAAHLQATQETAVPIATIAGEMALETAEHDKEMNKLRLQWQHEEHESAHDVVVAVNKAAARTGLDSINYQLVAVNKAQTQIEVEKHRQLTEIDIEAKLKEMLNTISAVVRFGNIGLDKFDEVLKRIEGLLEKIDAVQHSNRSPILKGQLMALYEDAVGMHKEVLNGIKLGLLETSNGQEINGMGAFDSFFGGLPTDIKSVNENSLSVIKPGNRSRDSDYERGDA